MIQAVMTEPGKIELREVEEPTAGPGEILLRIKKIGVCGSDIHVWHGLHPFTPYPVVQGHEYSGVVEAVGEGVTKVDLLSMDIEQGEPAALAGFDIQRFRPELVCIEALPEVSDAILEYFTRHGYRRIERYLEYDKANWYFTPQR